MQYLSLALYAEGPTDYRFLSPVLHRLCQDICLEEARGHVDIPEAILPLDDTEDMKHAPAPSVSWLPHDKRLEHGAFSSSMPTATRTPRKHRRNESTPPCDYSSNTFRKQGLP